MLESVLVILIYFDAIKLSRSIRDLSRIDEDTMFTKNSHFYSRCVLT